MRTKTAIEILERLMGNYTFYRDKRTAEALDMAIHALKNIEKYNNTKLTPERIIEIVENGHLPPLQCDTSSGLQIIN